MSVNRNICILIYGISHITIVIITLHLMPIRSQNPAWMGKADIFSLIGISEPAAALAPIKMASNTLQWQSSRIHIS